ncbi:MAG: 1-deoxy-D-xylulose-5-phosphate reductoisomerase [Planctomycetota bacterium]
MRTVAILGSTGSVGQSTIKVMPELEDTHRVSLLVAHRNASLIVSQARRFRPDLVALIDSAAAQVAEKELRAEGIPVLAGEHAAVEALREAGPDVVMAAIMGAAGLPSALEAVRMGALLALANKEALVMAGNILTRAARESGARIVPVDSEHSAIFQAIQGERGEQASSLRRLFLTASGGPFLDLPKDGFAAVSPEQALRHPTWEMGRKITIDSATMMNKALEIIEARWLFGVPSEMIEVLIHRQSIVHSMVEFVDGSILAQLGLPSMTVPVRYALSYPERAATPRSYFDLDRFSHLTFERPDRDRFPAIDLGHEVARNLGLAGTALNAANEVAVRSFLHRKTSFDAIPKTVRTVLDRLDNRTDDPDLEQILDTDSWAREEAEKCLSSS